MHFVKAKSILSSKTGLISTGAAATAVYTAIPAVHAIT